MSESVLFDRYELLEAAGRGGSAEVWRALDRQTGEIVAVKRLHPIAFADEAARHRLEREFRLLRSLDEPHLVRVRDLHIADREAALILDYVDGASLASRLAALRATGERMALDAGGAIIADVAAALGAAHDAGLVHRDVTPGNILLGADGQAHLTDFGIAHMTGEDGTATAVTAPGLVLGTMRYLAPEQLRGEPATPASDLHALAAVAYEIAAGRPAYEVATPVALIEAQQQGAAPIDDVPPAVDRIIRQGLDPDPAARPSDVRAFAAALTAAVGGPAGGDPAAATVAIELPVAGASLPAVAASAPAVAAPGRTPAGAAPVRTRRSAAGVPRRVPGAVAAAMALAIAVLIVAAAGGVGSGPANGPQPSAARATPSATHPARTPAPTSPPKLEHGDGSGHGGGHGKDHGKGHDG